MAERYRIEDRSGMTAFAVVVDTATGRDLCEADSCEAPEDASVYRAFAPLLDECNALATALTAAESRAAEAERLREADHQSLEWTWSEVRRIAEALGMGDPGKQTVTRVCDRAREVVGQRDAWAKQCNFASEAQADALNVASAATARAEAAEALIAKAHAAIGGRDSHGPEGNAACLIDTIHSLKEASRENSLAEAAATERAEAADAALARHQTEPDPADPDGWIRRSALNHWVERAAQAENDRDSLRTRLAAVEAENRSLHLENERMVAAWSGAQGRLAAVERELERHRHGATIEGDDACPHELRLRAVERERDDYRQAAFARATEIMHLTADLRETRATALREAIAACEREIAADPNCYRTVIVVRDRIAALLPSRESLTGGNEDDLDPRGEGREGEPR